MAMSIQFHKFEGIPKHDHNVRSIEEAHIRGEDEGGFYKILKDCDWKNEVDNVIFKNDIADFNAKQTRKDRLKNSYYDECKERENKDEERKILKKSQGQNDYNVFRPVHEFVVGFYGDDINVKEKERLIEKYVEDFEKKYSDNLVIVGAYIHGDEQKSLLNSGKKTLDKIDLHLHLDVVPVAHGYKRGMENQISLSGALKELGFEHTNKKENNLVNFESKQREELERILNKDRAIPIAIVPTKKEKKVHLEKEQFIAQQENEFLKEEHSNLKKEKRLKQREILTIENEIENKKSEMNYYYKEIDKNKEELEKIEKDLNDKKIEFTQTVTAVNELEKKGDFLHTKLTEKKEEFEFVKNEIENLKNDIEKSSLQYQLNQEQSQELVDSLHNAFIRGIYAGRKIETEKMEGKAKDDFINSTIQKQFQEISPSLQLIQDNNNKLKNIINEKISSFKKLIERKKEEKKVDKVLNQIHYADLFTLYFDRDGKISQKSEQYLEKEIVNNLYNKTDNKDWSKLQDLYFNLDNENRQELVQHIKKDCIAKLRDYNSNEIELKREKFKNYIYSKSPNYCRFGQGLLQKIKEMNDYILDGYER